MKKTKKEIIEMYSFIKLMSIIYKEMGSDLFNNLEMAIDQIGVEENQVLKKALEYQENQNNILKEKIKNQEAFIDRQGILINELKK